MEEIGVEAGRKPGLQGGVDVKNAVDGSSLPSVSQLHFRYKAKASNVNVSFAAKGILSGFWNPKNEILNCYYRY